MREASVNGSGTCADASCSNCRQERDVAAASSEVAPDDFKTVVVPVVETST
jgi:hypothetical protein